VLTPRKSESEEVFEGGALQQSEKMTKLKRYRMKKIESVSIDVPKSKSQESPEDIAEEPAPEAPSNPPTPSHQPKNLAEKIALDFANESLVTASAEFAVPAATFCLFGGLRLGEKFKLDKVAITRTDVAPASDGLEDVYSWKGPSWVNGATHMAVLCQKGQKSADDPTPNQDNYFVLHVGAIGIYGVCDGHGPFGHLVSFRLVQLLPHFLTKSANFGKDWELALKEAFVEAQRELLAFCRAQSINVEASGAAGTVLVFEGPSLHVAHIGDAGALVASWNRRDSRVIFGTKDHKPQIPEERARLEAAGSEVRAVDEDSCRIYLPGQNFPGLTMSRAFGDTACAGILQEPSYHKLFVQPGDEYYAIVASDGIWEFLDYEKVVELSAKKLRLKGPRETVRFLTEASRKRWAYCCGDYCDDITALLVQWNVKDKSGAQDTNHMCCVTRHN